MNFLSIIPGFQGPTEVLLIVFVVLLLFGSKKLPQLARSLGKSLNEFKQGQRERDVEDEKDQEGAMLTSKKKDSITAVNKESLDIRNDEDRTINSE